MCDGDGGRRRGASDSERIAGLRNLIGERGYGPVVTYAFTLEGERQLEDEIRTGLLDEIGPVFPMLGHIAVANDFNASDEGTQLEWCTRPDRAMTLDEVGQVLGITRERVRQIEESAFTKLRQHPLMMALRPGPTRAASAVVWGHGKKAAARRSAARRRSQRRAAGLCICGQPLENGGRLSCERCRESRRGTVTDDVAHSVSSAARRGEVGRGGE